MNNQRNSQTLSLTTGGITLLGVLLSVGATVGFGIKGEWWIRALAGTATTLVLTIVVKLGTKAGHGPVARLALWVIGSEDKQAE